MIEFIETLKQREMPVIIRNHDWRRNCKSVSLYEKKRQNLNLKLKTEKQKASKEMKHMPLFIILIIVIVCGLSL